MILEQLRYPICNVSRLLFFDYDVALLKRKLYVLRAVQDL